MRVSRAVENLGLSKRFAPLSPDWPIAAIGDIHGCFDLFEQILTTIPADLPVVCLGNYIDHGPQSAKLLRHLYETPEILCLKGNHEDLLLDFLRAPLKQGRNWLKKGGIQTLAAFDLVAAGHPPDMADHELLDMRDALAAQLGDGLMSWLANLPASCLSGNVLFAHAGANPAAPPQEQRQRHLTWGHRDFYRLPRKDGIWVIHGHKFVPEPKAAQNRIALNTGAYKTGRLTAVVLHEGEHVFYST